MKQTAGPFRSLGEQLRAIASAEDPGRRFDSRLHEVQKRAAAAGASEAVPTDGGFLISPHFSREIVQRFYDTGEVYKRCFEVPVSTNGFKFPQFDESSRVAGSRLGGIEAYWENEAAAMTPASLQASGRTQKPTFNLSEVVPAKITGLLVVSDELSVDSSAFETWSSYAFQQELLFKIEAAIVNGTGAGQPLGVVQSPAVMTVAKQSGQASGTVVSQNVNSMLAALWARSYNSEGTIFLYNQALLPQLSTLATVVGTAGSESKLWAWAKSADGYDMLAGFPAIASEYCGYPGTTGDIMLCDFSRYILAIREKFRAEMSIHVRFLTSENTFRFIARCGGQPIDRSPVVAATGGYSTSPFVALAPR